MAYDRTGLFINYMQFWEIVGNFLGWSSETGIVLNRVFVVIDLDQSSGFVCVSMYTTVFIYNVI